MTPETRPEIVTLGECLASFVALEPGPLVGVDGFRRVIAGAEANVAVGLSRLGHTAGFIGRVGDDPFGETILRALRADGVDTACVRIERDGWTGLMVRDRPGVGPSSVEYRRRDSAGSHLAPDDVAAAAAWFASARWLHVTGITLAISATSRAAVLAALELARGHGVPVSLDVNLRRKLWSDEDAVGAIRPLLAGIEVVLGSTEELAVLTGLGEATPEALARGVLELGAATAVVKLGAGGALEMTAGGPPVLRPAVPVPTTVDTVGAGDGFCAGWIAARLEGLAGAARLDLANACGAAALSAIGDQPGLPTRAQAAQIGALATGEVLR